MSTPVTATQLRALVVLGGMIGTAARYGLYEAWPADGTGFPATTLAVNAIGAGLLGLLVASAPGASPGLQQFARVGVLGGFTTFSTFAVELATRIRDDRVAVTAAYVVTMTVTGVAAAALGLRLGGRLRVQP